MKKLFTIIFVISTFLLFSASPTEAACLAMQGTIVSTGNWPAEGRVVIGCYGDTPALNCGGNSASLVAGQTFNFQNCSCLVSREMWVDSSPPGCTTSITGNKYGDNGDIIYPDVVVNCPVPTNIPTATPVPTVAPTPTTFPTPTTPYVPVPPATVPPGATATPAPFCGKPCSSPATCVGAIGGCTYCNPATDTCTVPPPGATATPTRVPSATPTRIPTGIPTATLVPSATPTRTPTPIPSATPTPTSTPVPTATPTPTPLPFDESMCKCDGLEFTSIALGTTTNVTAYGRVLGINKNYAKIPTFNFKFFQGNGTTVTELKNEIVNTTVVEETAEKTRYQAKWALALPSTLDKSLTYRIQAVPKCSRKSAALFNPTPDRVVLAVNDQPKGIWAMVMSFFTGLFGGNTTTTIQNTATTSVRPTLTVLQRKQLQLKTFTPATGIATDNCSFIKFNF